MIIGGEERVALYTQYTLTITPVVGHTNKPNTIQPFNFKDLGEVRNSKLVEYH